MTEIINTARQSRRGRTALDDPRRHCVSVRLNRSELLMLNSKRGPMKQGEWLRCAALDKLPSVVPEVNQQKWLELARAAANLNQIARALHLFNGISTEEVDQVRKALTEFRAALLGAFVSNMQ
jgi:Bacterial mobilisation protein (MobC)